VLSLQDFVAPQISWGAKAAAIESLKRVLNLQSRHIVFIDDRPDERALVSEAHPDIVALDAGSEETWQMIDLWGETTFGSSDVDRTRMYQQNALRDAAMQTDSPAAQGLDPQALSRLKLEIVIGSAQKKDLKRIAELINRTNQWNLCGSRTTLDQVRRWVGSRHSHVLVANVVDRFGDMGAVCVAVVEETPEVASIPVFVLSCRVFGYGIETAMLNAIASRCDIGGRIETLIGEYRANAQNQPCRNMYTDHGFTVVDGRFCWSGEPTMPSVSWATVQFTLVDPAA